MKIEGIIYLDKLKIWWFVKPTCFYFNSNFCGWTPSSPKHLRDNYKENSAGVLQRKRHFTVEFTAMKDQNLDLFDPRTAVMDPEYSPSRTRDPDFGFAFNDSNFSDRLLQIEIMADSSDTDSLHSQSLADWARNRKRRREDIKKEMGLSLLLLFLSIFSFVIRRLSSVAWVST